MTVLRLSLTASARCRKGVGRRFAKLQAEAFINFSTEFVN